MTSYYRIYKDELSSIRDNITGEYKPGVWRTEGLDRIVIRANGEQYYELRVLRLDKVKVGDWFWDAFQLGSVVKIEQTTAFYEDGWESTAIKITTSEGETDVFDPEQTVSVLRPVQRPVVKPGN